MKEIYLLTLYLIKSFLKDTFIQEKNIWNKILKSTVFLVILAFFLFITIKSYCILSTGNLEYLVIPLILTIASISSMIFAIYLVLSNFSFANDNEFLLSLPVSKKTLFISKYLFIEITLLPISILVAILLFTYGILSKASIIFYVFSLISALLISVVPLCYGVFIALIFSRLSIRNENKEHLERIFTITSILLIIGIVYFSIKSFMTQDSLLSLINPNSTFKFSFMNIIFPLNMFITKGLVFTNSSLGIDSMLFSLGLSIVFIMLSVFIGERLYYKILLNNSNITKSNKSQKKNLYKDSSSILITLIKRDFLSLLRSNQFFLYTIGIFPMFVLIVCTFIPVFKAFITIESLENNYIIAYIYLISLSSLFASFNVTASTSFSREGRYLPFLLQMPINIKTILFSKILIALALSSLMIILNLILLAFLHLPILVYIFMGISMIIFTVFIVMVSIFNDISKPNIKWNYEKDLVKDNMSLFKSGIYPIIYTPCILVIHLILNKTPLAYTSQFYVLAIILIILGVIFTIGCYKKILSKINILYSL